MPKKTKKETQPDTKSRVIPPKILVFLMLTLVGILTYNAWQNSQIRNDYNPKYFLSPTPSEKDSFDPAYEGWSEYKNTEHNLELKYPADWNMNIDDKVQEFPIIYISKEKTKDSAFCQQKTSCLVITPSNPGRGSYAFDIKYRQKKIKKKQTKAVRVDYYAYNGAYYSSVVLFDSEMESPFWTKGTVEILPLITDEKFSEGEVKLENGEKETIKKLESARTDREDLEILEKIFSSINFTERSCPEGQELTSCKLGNCCCPTGADCD